MKLKSPDLLRAFVGPEPTKKMSGRRLARAAGVHPSYIDHLLHARCKTAKPATATRIAEALEVPVTILFETAPSPARQQQERKAS